MSFRGYGKWTADLREADRIDRRSVLRHTSGDRASGPFEEGGLIGGGVDQDVRIEEDQGSRVMVLRESQVIFGRRGAAAMASRQLSMLIPGLGFGGSRRTRSRRPSPWLWMSKTSPGLASGRTTRRLASVVHVAMVGLSRQIPASAKELWGRRRMRCRGRDVPAVIEMPGSPPMSGRLQRCRGPAQGSHRGTAAPSTSRAVWRRPDICGEWSFGVNGWGVSTRTRDFRRLPRRSWLIRTVLPTTPETPASSEAAPPARGAGARGRG